MTLAVARTRANIVAHKFVIKMWTLSPAITKLITVDTHYGILTLIKPRTHQTLTTLFILPIDTVVIAVAPRVDWQTVEPLLSAAVVTRRTRGVFTHGLLGEVPCPVQVDKESLIHLFYYWSQVGGMVRTADLVRVVQTV